MSRARNVPRETTPPKVKPNCFIRMTEAEYGAVKMGFKTTSREVVCAANSSLSLGTFNRLQLSSGRVRWLDLETCELRMRHSFKTGVRVVGVSPVMKKGDAASIYSMDKKGISYRSGDGWLLIERVRATRLQDITDAEVIDEGILAFDFIVNLPRERFAAHWDVRHGANSPYAWLKNPWVWQYCYRYLNKAATEGES